MNKEKSILAYAAGERAPRQQHIVIVEVSEAGERTELERTPTNIDGLNGDLFIEAYNSGFSPVSDEADIDDTPWTPGMTRCVKG